METEWKLNPEKSRLRTYRRSGKAGYRILLTSGKAGGQMGECEKDQFGNLLSAFKPINNKPIVADEAEVEANPRSRSAKLRLGERTNL